MSERFAVALFLLATVPVFPQNIDDVVRDLTSVHSFTGVSISPDGRQVAWIERTDSDDGSIFVRAVAGGRPVRITAGDGKKAWRETAMGWAPDSEHIAFLSDAAQRGQLDVYVADTAGGPPRRISKLHGDASTPSWSPDGRRVAVLYTENSPRKVGAANVGARQVGVIGNKVYEQRVAAIDIKSGAVKQVSPPDLYVYEYDWAPDGNRIAIVAAPGEGENNWWVASLLTVDVATGAAKQIAKPKDQLAIPRWSPDGKSIAYISGLMSDEGAVGGDVFMVPADGGTATNITPGIKLSPSSLHWLSPHRLVVTATQGGGTSIGSLDPAHGGLEILWHGPESLKASRDAGVSFSTDGRATATIRMAWNRPPEVYVGAIGEWRAITSDNAQAKPIWGEVKDISWPSGSDKVQGWLMYPKHYQAGKKYPLIVSVHGGPSAAKKAMWPDETDVTGVLSSQGYFVLMPNPRGSFGQGEAFTRANIKDFGGGDFRDTMAGVEFVSKMPEVDSQRIGITGWSYGGYITMWAVTQTNRFKAAMAGAGISDWRSYYGQNSIDQWMIPFFGASVYDDPAVYAKSSPIDFIKNVKTPTLLLVGERDLECPSPQSIEFYHALRTLNVPSELVIYEDEGHAISQPAHRLDRLKRTVDWFNKYLK